eukprot:CAMPEP_0184056182 /NCGR_PEP_ID=MMETSP0956-20121227/7627_1 /TAXON_ID=627963 /ORGANISM="Aplanochytrium sp, Strain PBS07" /LENGTH=534 /DNA_ID=CAMNT_0026350163 /DNA_START=371 /DNA_END=1976 /DNA_ORIENTATION=-
MCFLLLLVVFLIASPQVLGEKLVEVKSFTFSRGDGSSFPPGRRNLDSDVEGSIVRMELEDGARFECLLESRIQVFAETVTKTLLKGTKESDFECQSSASYRDASNNCVFSVYEDGMIKGAYIDVETNLVYSIGQPAGTALKKAVVANMEDEEFRCGVDADASYNLRRGLKDNHALTFHPSGSQEHEHSESEPASAHGRKLLDRWDGCYPGMDVGKSLLVGVAVGSEAVKKNGGLCDVHDAIVNMVAETNLVFSAQVNVYILMNHLYVVDPDTRSSSLLFDNANCGDSIFTQFNNFRDFLPQESVSGQGFWHLVDDCFGEGESSAIGIAYVGGMCNSVTSTGITYKSPSNSGWGTTWLTFAHETGHLFGMQHSFEEGQGKTGGIMDYGRPEVDGQIQFNRKYREAEMCTQIKIEINDDCPYLIDNSILVATGSLNLEKNASAQMVEKTVTAARTAKYRGNVLHIKTNAAPTLVNMLTPHIPARTAIHKEGIALKEYVRRQIVSSLDGNIAALMTTIAVNFHAFETISVTIWLGLL